MKSEAAKGADGEPSPAKPMITPAEPAEPSQAPVRARPVTPRPSRVYAVELPSFEGPLDLLLHLVRRHELDILDIPIAFVTEKYLEYLSIMRSLDIEILGDYLVMAATLAYLKSRELVPQQASEEEGGDEDDEDGEDPREALIRRLIEYERFRAAGRELNEMPVIGRDVFARGGNIDLPPLDPGMAPVTLFRLAESYSRVLQRAQINKSHEVQLERVTVRQRMEQLSLLLEKHESVEFESLFLEQVWGSVEELRQMLVVTLMSVLELVKLGIMGVQQVHESESIHLRRRASYAQAMKALTSYSETDSFGEGGGIAGGGQAVTPEIADAPVAMDEPVSAEPALAELPSEPGAVPVAEEPVDSDLAVDFVSEQDTERDLEPVVEQEQDAEQGVEQKLGGDVELRYEQEAEHGVEGDIEERDERDERDEQDEQDERDEQEAEQDTERGVDHDFEGDVERRVEQDEQVVQGEQPVERDAEYGVEQDVDDDFKQDVDHDAKKDEPEVEQDVDQEVEPVEQDEQDEPEFGSEPPSSSGSWSSAASAAKADPVAREEAPTVSPDPKTDFSSDALGAMLAGVRRLVASDESAGEASEGSSRSAEPEVGAGEPEVADADGADGHTESSEGSERLQGADELGLSGPSAAPEPGEGPPDEEPGDTRGDGGETTFIDAVDDSGESHE